MEVNADRKYLDLHEVSRYLTEHKLDLVISINLRWPPEPCFRAHVKTDSGNRVTVHKQLHDPFMRLQGI